jgi:hypothetical protein
MLWEVADLAGGATVMLLRGQLLWLVERDERVALGYLDELAEQKELGQPAAGLGRHDAILARVVVGQVECRLPINREH